MLCQFLVCNSFLLDVSGAMAGPNHFMQIQGGGGSIWMFAFWSILFNFYCPKQVKTKRSFILLLYLKYILNDDG